MNTTDTPKKQAPPDSPEGQNLYQDGSLEPAHHSFDHLPVDIDTSGRSHFVRIFTQTSYFLAIPVFVGCLFLFKNFSLLTAALLALACTALTIGIISLLISFILDQVASGAVRIFSGFGERSRSTQEMLVGSLDQVRHLKSKKKFREALHTVNKILEQEPHMSEALFLKAHIMADGFGNFGAARANLRKILKTAPQKDKHRKWAVALLQTLSERQKSDSA